MAEPRRPLVSIVAPPGYGKTVLLAEWARREVRSVAWLTIDDLDNDTGTLLTYVAAALDRVQPIVGSGFPPAGSSSHLIGSVVPRLSYEMQRWARPGVLILDDVHRLVSQASIDALTMLLEHAPPGFQIALAGRTMATLPIALFRAHRVLLEFGRNELALSADETQALAAGAGRHLDADAARALTEQTEGWAAATYLAAIAGVADENAPGRPVRISGRDGFIAEYIRAALQPDVNQDDMTLLTRTSILEPVEVSLAEEVAGLPHVPERLESLARRNQLVMRVGETPATYRYHHLLRDYLRAELELRELGATPELHRVAASWYATHGHAAAAIEHAFASGDVDAAARMVTAVGLLMHYRGQRGQLDRWLHQFDDRVFERHPGLAVFAAYINALEGRPGAADRMADAAERSTVTGDAGDGAASIDSSRAMLRAFLMRVGPENALADASLAVAAEQPGSPWRSNALSLLGMARWVMGDFDAADAAFTEANDLERRSGRTHIVAVAGRASLAMARGDWDAAAELARDSHNAAERSNFGDIATGLLVHAVAARVASHRGDAQRSRQELVHAQLVLPQVSYALPYASVMGLLELARTYLALGDTEGAKAMLSEAEGIIRHRPNLGVLIGDVADVRRQADSAGRTVARHATLTPAELRVLPMLSTHLTLDEIGGRLSVSRHTVKAQSVSIYGKLGVSGRSEAIDRAIAIGLLEPFPGLRLTARPTRD